jgi:tetratricopeptide (TPR) repeat protein
MNEEADELVDEAIGNTKKLYKLLDGRADVSALWGALLGFKIVLSNYNSIHVGPKSLRLIKSASDSGDEYFNASLERANLLFYTPKILGGSKEEAMDYYRKAVKVIEQSNLKEERNWIYINTILLLANAYSETGSQSQACELYEGLLEYEPGAEWIRKDLLSNCGK